MSKLPYKTDTDAWYLKDDKPKVYLNIPHEMTYLEWRVSVYTALERNRSYRIGLGDEARVVTYLYRDFPEDHPAVFTFMDQETGELVGFLIEQLTDLEQQGAIEYLGVTLTPEKDDGGSDGR